ncbi:MAG: ATP-dependent sacrificial sulfur transferase LarE [Cyclobacteriaceae bacterium]
MVEKQLEVLEKWFIARKKTITAFSGGIDSSLVLYLSKYFLGENAVACISNSASLKRNELEQAKAFCQKYEIKLEVIQTEEMNDQNYLQNPSNRCYYCKNHLYMSLHQLSIAYPEYILLNGVNADDLGDYRPGLQAASEHNIQSPLVDCNIDKDSVREIAKYLGLDHWNKPASPCLSSRIPYGSEVNLEKLNRIEGAEAILNKYGFEDVRVRHFDQEARIEVPSNEIDKLYNVLNPVSEEIQKLGFESCSIDNEGLISGKLNRVLNG